MVAPRCTYRLQLRPEFVPHEGGPAAVAELLGGFPVALLTRE